MVDPRDYDRLRHLQMNGGAPNTFEETIYKVNREKTGTEIEFTLRIEIYSYCYKLFKFYFINFINNLYLNV